MPQWQILIRVKRAWCSGLSGLCQERKELDDFSRSKESICQAWVCLWRYWVGGRLSFWMAFAIGRGLPDDLSSALGSQCPSPVFLDSAGIMHRGSAGCPRAPGSVLRLLSASLQVWVSRLGDAEGRALFHCLCFSSPWHTVLVPWRIIGFMKLYGSEFPPLSDVLVLNNYKM